MNPNRTSFDWIAARKRHHLSLAHGESDGRQEAGAALGRALLLASERLLERPVLSQSPVQVAQGVAVDVFGL